MPRLLITADDYGIGLETSRGILELAERGVVTSTVLLVNSPYAEESVRLWNRLSRPVELGWHPVLTLDGPVSHPDDVPSLVDAAGRFLPLGTLLKKLLWNRVNETEIRRELRAQLDRFRELTGVTPANVNGHHHIHIFPPVTAALFDVLEGTSPYIRRVIETSRSLWRVKGARLKRAVLSHFGRHMPRTFPGNDHLLGITDPQFVHDPQFFANWLRQARGEFLELTCHPGHFDESLIGRDGSLVDGNIHRRPAELTRLTEPAFVNAVKQFHLVTAKQCLSRAA